MRADIIELIRAADPAAVITPEDPSAKERLRAEVLAVPAERGARRAARRRARLVLVAVVLAAALGAGGWTVYSSLVTGPESALEEFHDAQARLTLPPGATWHEPQLPEASYGRYMGLNIALDQATCAWFEEWDDAASAGDGSRAAAASSAVRRIRALMPLHRAGEPEEAGGFDAASLAAFDGLIADAERGRMRDIRQYVRANC